MSRRDGAVLLGGALGTLARAAIAEVLDPSTGGWPWHTFTANVAGAFLLAVLVASAGRQPDPDDVLLALLGTGVLGSLTTFSTFTVEVRQLGLTGTGLTYGVASVVAGLLAVRAGRALVERRAASR